MSQFVVCEPGGGIVQGEALGLLFCWDGSPDDDLPVDACAFFDTREEAEEVRKALLNLASSAGSRSLPTLEKMEVVEVTPQTDLANLAREWVARGAN